MINIGQHADARDTAGERAVIYARTYHDSLGSALNDQLEQCRSAARMLGVVVIEEVHDVDAPAELDAERPGWRRVVSLIQSHSVDLVLSLDLARITRRWDDMPTLMALHREHGVDFLSVQTLIRPADSPGAAHGGDSPEAPPARAQAIRHSAFDADTPPEGAQHD